jgi:hypothetical protein
MAVSTPELTYCAGWMPKALYKFPLEGRHVEQLALPVRRQAESHTSTNISKGPRDEPEQMLVGRQVRNCSTSRSAQTLAAILSYRSRDLIVRSYSNAKVMSRPSKRKVTTASYSFL